MLRTGKQKDRAVIKSFKSLDDHHFKKEDPESVGEVSKVCAQIVLKCLCLARIGRLGILWSGDKLARSVTTWTGACDKRLARLISYIHHTGIDNVAMWETRLSICRWVYSKSQILMATLRTRNQPRVESCVPLKVEHLSP